MLVRLNVGQEAEFVVDAKQPWNVSGIELVAGTQYEIRSTVTKPPWKDAWIGSGLTTGWRGPARVVEKLVRGRARAPHLPMYSLVGSIGQDPATFFLLGDATVLNAPGTGELSAFANDWPGRYENNHGGVTVRIRRV